MRAPRCVTAGGGDFNMIYAAIPRPAARGALAWNTVWDGPRYSSLCLISCTPLLCTCGGVMCQSGPCSEADKATPAKTKGVPQALRLPARPVPRKSKTLPGIRGAVTLVIAAVVDRLVGRRCGRKYRGVIFRVGGYRS